MLAVQHATNASEVNGENLQIGSKRMLLSEVYVHKKRRKIALEDILTNYEVFHIFEVVEQNLYIQPRLATNCNETGDVIDALKNASGSDTPQMQRLITRLSEASKYSIRCLVILLLYCFDY